MRTAFVLLALCCLVSTSSVQGQNLLQNGGFEAPGGAPVIQLGVYNGMAGYDIPTFGWTISPFESNPSGDIDHVTSYWAPHSGLRSIDLNGFTIGTVQQIVATVPGGTYDLSFWYSNNAEMRTNPDDIAQANLFVIGGSGNLHHTLLTHSGANFLNMASSYTFFSTSFTADSNSTIIRFEGMQSMEGDSSQGIVLDDIALSFSSVPEPGTWALILGAGSLGGGFTWLRWRNRKGRSADRRNYS